MCPKINHPPHLDWRPALLWSATAVVSFHVAYSRPLFSFAILVFLFCLFQLRNVSSKRKAFYFGLGIGLAIYAPQLNFFYGLFGFGAVALWLVLAFWIALFLLLAKIFAKRFGAITTALLIPCIWTGLEYFRSELYYLRFSWLNVGFAFQTHLSSTLGLLGVYGIGFVLALVASMANLLRSAKSFGTIGVVAMPMFLLGGAPWDFVPYSSLQSQAPQIAGVQLEFPSERDVLTALDRLVATHPSAELIVLSEYTFNESVPEKVKAWCKENQRHLIVGAQDPTEDSNFYNTAFVIDPTGEIVFKQAKSVPIQFFKDGLPAREQKVWHSPWGKIGIAICYDLSYRRVMDQLVGQGAQALIIPTMDVIDWGEHQHQLHARVAPVRAAEYRIPIYRVCSSGISQFVDARGYVRAFAPFPGDGEMISGPLILDRAGRVPLDRWLAPLCLLIVIAIIGFVAVSKRQTKKE